MEWTKKDSKKKGEKSEMTSHVDECDFAGNPLLFIVMLWGDILRHLFSTMKKFSFIWIMYSYIWVGSIFPGTRSMTQVYYEQGKQNDRYVGVKDKYLVSFTKYA